MTPSRHLGCSVCRLRLRADSPAIAILEGRCPICGAPLFAATSASDLLGFRSFELSALLRGELDDPPGPPIDPVQLSDRRASAAAPDPGDAVHEPLDGDGGGRRVAVRQPLPL